MPTSSGLWVDAPSWDTAWAGARRALRTVAIDTSLWTAASLGALTLFVGATLGTTHDLRAALLLSVSALFVYNLDHTLDSRTHQGPTRGAALSTTTLAIITALSGAVTLWMLVQSSGAVRAVFALYGVVGILYATPVVPWRIDGRWTRIAPKAVPLGKPFIVAISITIATVGLPLAYGGLPWLEGAAAAVFMFAFIFTNASLFDIADHDEDTRQGVPTMAVSLGPERCRTWLLLLNNVAALALWLGGAVATAPLLIMLATLLLGVSSMAVVGARTSRAACCLVLEGTSFAPWLLYLIATSPG